MTFNEILRSLIEDLDLTQKQVAKDLSIAPSTLGGYVQGTSEPDFETLKMFADYFNVSTDFLLNHDAINLKNNNDDKILQLFRSLSPQNQELYIEIGKVMMKNQISNKSTTI
ncbi:MAG: helix-turn-helix transcriptional regulator [Clostridia bacterium]|nr:helix-turn-helix transcriptional regulator [Clostridia bacterium]